MANEKKTRMALVGLGDRGVDVLDTLSKMDDVEVVGLCDVDPAARARGNDKHEANTGRRTAEYASIDALLAEGKPEGVLIATSWKSHVPLAIKAMKAGVYAAFEVGAPNSLEECWSLVRAYEQTGTPCMMMTNCDYGERELAVLRMIRAGLFGEITHVEGGYKHDHRRSATALYGKGAERAWENLRRNADLYPQHTMGPVMNYLNLNRGNRMLTLVSMASKNLGMNLRYQTSEEAKTTPRNFQMGDIVTTMIKCAGGETILLTHDVCSPRPYSRGGLVQGTKGLWSEELKSVHVEGRSGVEKWEPEEQYLLEFRHPFWNEKEKYKDWHHGGMDFMMLRSFLYAVRNRVEPVVDAYDSATLLAIPVLSEMSIQLGSQPVAVPDFTGGRWLDREPQPASVFALDTIHDECFTEGWTF